MNKNLHRVVFNAVRKARMVVQETARSAGKSTTTASGVVGLAAAAVVGATTAQAQAIGATNVPGTLRPTVLAAPNGVPIVNITTPSAAGVSRNVYSRFDVQSNGLILNNSRTTVQTQLGGFVQGNPWLATGSARIVLNEINSGQPTRLNGWVELAGPRVEVVIANPAGIQVNGGGFINASRATLTTGVPQLNAFGGLDGYRVSGGTISVDGQGLDMSQTDEAAIYARAMQINAGLWANRLKVVTGANQIGADDTAITPIAGTGPTPLFALDTAVLGGMYANKITLVGTEAGLGVFNAGHLSSTGEFIVTVDGRLQNTGTLQADTQLAVNAPAITNSGTIAAGTDVHLAASAGDLVNSGLIQAPHLDLASAAQVDNRGGTLRQTSSASLTVTAPSLSNTAGGTIGPEPVASTGTDTDSTVDGDGASSPSPTTDSATAAAPSPSTSAVNSGTTAPPEPVTPPQPGTVTAASGILNDGGHIEAGGPIHLSTPQIDNTGGHIAVSDLAVSGPRFSNAGGTLDIANGFQADVGSFDNSAGGRLNAGRVEIATMGDLYNLGGVIQSNSDTILTIGGAVDNQAGAVSAIGALTATVAGDVQNTEGAFIANGAVSIQARSLDNTLGSVASTGAGTTVALTNALLNSGIIAAATDLSVQAGSMVNSSNLRGGNDASIGVAGELASDGSITAGGDVTIAAGSLSGAGVLGAGIADDGSLGSTGDLHVSTTGALMAQGQNLAAGDATLQGASVDLANSTTSAANIALTATQGDVTTSGATVVTPGTLSVRANAQSTQTLVNQGGAVSAGTLDVRTANVDNSSGGQILQTGLDAAIVAVGGQLDNDSGVIASNGDLTLGAGALNNRGGVVRAANGSSLDLHVAGALDNSAEGDISTDGNTTLQAGSLKNDGGSITAVGNLDATIAQAASNVEGTLAANGDVNVSAASLDSTGGTVSAITGDLRVSTTGTMVNAGGRMLAGGNTAIVNAGLDNTSGKVLGESLSIDTHGGGLTNTQGRLAAVTTVAIDSGALANDAGLIHSGDAMTIDTHGQQLTNADTLGDQITDPDAPPQGILSGATLQLATGALDNRLGYIRSADALRATTEDVTNDGGAVLGGDTITIDAQAGRFTNIGGQVLAPGDVTITSGAIDNTAGLLGSAGTLTLQDSNRATPAAKTLSIVNTGGTLAGGTSADPDNGTPAFGGIVIDAANYQLGDGTLASANDIAIALTQDIASSAALGTSGNLNVSTTGSFTNVGALLAGRTLTVSANTIDNAASGEFSGADTHLVAGTVTNRGLIDSNGQTRIDAASGVTNLGTGRIYGDHVAIGTGALTNAAEMIDGITTSATIASRGDLDIGAAQIDNRDGALIFSAGDLYVGGALDTDGFATGTAAQLNNHSADIESLGSMDLTVANVDNRDTHLQVVPGASVEQSSTTQLAVYLNNIGLWTYDTTITTDGIANDRPAIISAGGDLTLSGNLVNRDSRVLAGNELALHGSVDNQATQGQRVVSVHTTVDGTDGAGFVHFDLGTVVTPTSVDLTAYEPQAHQAIGAIGGIPGAASAGSSAAGGTSQATGQGAGPILEVPSAVGSGAGVTGADADGSASASQGVPMVVRTAPSSVQLPTASLFRVRPQGGSYLIETDPRFADYRHWLSSDYLLNNLGLDPNNVLKRLGDGFYEQRLIREQVAQLTGYRYLDGYQSDEDEYLALMNASVTFAREFNLVPGVALTPEQMAQLTSDIVWLVEQTVTLPDGSTQQVLVPQVYVRVQPGDIDGHGTLLSGDRVKIDPEPGAGAVTNGGTIAGRSLVSITADDIRNIDGGRISGGAVALASRNDLDNIGSTIDAKHFLGLEAGNDINIVTTTSATTLNGAVNGQVVDRVASVYVTEPNAILVMNAGHDLNVMGASIANRGENGQTGLKAGNDINLGTVTESNSFSYAAPNGKGYIATSRSDELGSTVWTNGATFITAGRDINARQANVNAGDGALIVNAGRNINIVDGQSTRSTAFALESSKKGTFSSSTTSMGASSETSTSVGSTFSGGAVWLAGGNNVNIVGSHISGTEGVAILAGNELNIVEGRNTVSSSAYFQRSTKGLMKDPFLTKDGANGNGIELSTNNAAASSITSSQGGVLLLGDNSVYLRGAEVSAAKDLTIQGGKVTIVGATNESGLTLSEDHQGGSVSMFKVHTPTHGFGSKSEDTYDAQATSLAPSSLQGANINISAENAQGIRGAVTIAGTTINTPGTLKLEGDKVNLPLQSTGLTMTQQGQGSDLMWQRTSDSGSSQETLNYNQINAGQLQINANRVMVGMNAKDSIETLAQQPGMGWVQQIANDPNLAGKIDWQKIEEAHKNWDYGKQGLSPEGATIILVAAIVLSAGTAAELGGALATSLGEGVALSGGGYFLTSTGLVISSATAAGFSSIVGQAAVSLANNQGDLGAVLHDLGSSEGVKTTLASMLTAGAGAYFVNNYGITSLGIKIAAGCASGELTGAGCQQGATWAGLTGLAGWAYNSLVEYEAYAGPGSNPENPIYQPDPVTGQQPWYSIGRNVVGNNELGYFCSQGTTCSQILNTVPFINATAGFHDLIFNAGYASFNPFTNVATMPPAAMFSILASLNDPAIAWLLNYNSIINGGKK